MLLDAKIIFDEPKSYGLFFLWLLIFSLLILFEVEVADADNISINKFSIILLQLYKYNV